MCFLEWDLCHLVWSLLFDEETEEASAALLAEPEEWRIDVEKGESQYHAANEKSEAYVGGCSPAQKSQAFAGQSVCEFPPRKCNEAFADEFFNVMSTRYDEGQASHFPAQEERFERAKSVVSHVSQTAGAQDAETRVPVEEVAWSAPLSGARHRSVLEKPGSDGGKSENEDDSFVLL